jgi:hypothetical protein
MELLISILNITMVILIARAIFSIVASIILTKKVREAKENQVIIGEQLKEQKQQLQAHLQSLMVQDDYCGKMINKEKAFIVLIDNKPHHFCSWDCRQKYITESA